MSGRFPISCRWRDKSSIGKGQPVSGARVYLYVNTEDSLTHTSMLPSVRATSGADGRFRFTIDRIELASGLVHNGYPRVFLAAFAAGYGPAWANELTIDEPAAIAPGSWPTMRRSRADCSISRAAAAGREHGAWCKSTRRRRRTFRRGCRRARSNPNTARRSFSDVHEVAAGQPRHVDSPGQRPTPTADSSSEVPAVSRSSILIQGAKIRRRSAGDNARRAVDLDPVPAPPTGADDDEYRYFDLHDWVQACYRPRAGCGWRRRRCRHGPAGSGSGHLPQNDLPPGIRESLSTHPMAFGHVDTSHD